MHNVLSAIGLAMCLLFVLLRWDHDKVLALVVSASGFVYFSVKALQTWWPHRHG